MAKKLRQRSASFWLRPRPSTAFRVSLVIGNLEQLVVLLK